MPRVNIGDQRSRILRGILTDRGLTGAGIAKLLRKPVSTINYQIDHAESMPIDRLMEYANIAAMTDAEIAKVVRG